MSAQRRPKNRAACVLLACLTGCVVWTHAGFAADAPSPPTIRAAQILSFDSMTLAELDAELAALREKGFDTIIFRVFHNPGDRYHRFVPVNRSVKSGVYFRTTSAPVIADALRVLLPRARAKGLKVFAWMTSRYATYGDANNVEWRAQSYDLATKKFTPAKGLSLSHPAVRAYLTRLYRDLGRYPIDGILFQDDFVFRHTEDLSPAARRHFTDATGVRLVPQMLYSNVYTDDDGKVRVGSYAPLFWRWVRWKNQVLLDMAAHLHTAARTAGGNPDMRLALNFFYEAATAPDHGLAWVAQSIDAAARRNIDYLAIMAYHRQMANELNQSDAEIAQTIRTMARSLRQSVSPPARILIKLQVRDWDSRAFIPLAEQRRILDSAVSAGDVSLALVPVNGSTPVALPRDIPAASP